MSADKEKAKILVSDSIKNTREAVAEIFGEAGYTVSSASSGSETIERLTRETFDLILCDIDRPRSSGLEIVRMAKALNRQARIVVVSSTTGSAHRTRIKKEGAFELLDKPLRKATLLQVARDALKRRPAKKRKEVSQA